MQNEQKRKRFTKEESGRLSGRRVRLEVAFTDIPKGTTGVVCAADEVEPNGFEIIVQWEGVGADAHPRDWFTKEEFELALAEI
jgi:hypothetical protein